MIFQRTTGNRYVTWTLRILLMLMILFFALFSLDVFEESKGFWETTGDFLLHNILTFTAILILIIAWRWENIGGILLLLCIIAFGIVHFVHSDNIFVWIATMIMWSIIPVFISLMFIVNHYYFTKLDAEDHQ